MLVLQPDLDDAGVNGVIAQATELVGRGGGTVATTGQLVDKRGSVAEITEGWRTRHLAYTINGKRDGYYVVMRFQAPSTALDELERAFEINESILRYLVLRVEA